MSMKNNYQTFQKRLRLDSHHATERFGITTAAFSVALVALVGAVGVTATENGRVRISETALYTSSFTTSKTHLSGGVPGVYVSADRTRALVLMQFSHSDASDISANAKNYQAFLTGSTPSQGQQPLASDVSGQFVVFGTTGYMGVVLDSDQPFTPQILNLTMRANSQLVYSSGQTNALQADLESDGSFVEYDQWRLYVNPGASGAIEAPSLGSAGEEFSPVDTYYELVVKAAEDEARGAMDDALAEMQVGLAKIDEYTLQMDTTAVGGEKIVAPTVPRQLAGDTIKGTPGDDTDPLTLRTNWVDPKGFNFDWRGGSVSVGYLDRLVPAGDSLVGYLADKTEGSDEVKFSTNNLEWLLTDGSDLMTYGRSNEVMSPLLDIMNKLDQAYRTYFGEKTVYQTTLYNALVSLEVQLTNVDESTTVNNGEDVLLTY